MSASDQRPMVAVAHVVHETDRIRASGQFMRVIDLIGAFRAVWLGFSLTAVVLTVVLASAGIRPGQNNSRMLLMLSGIPFGSALLIYMYVGSFLGGHLLLAAGVFIVIGTFWPRAANNTLQATCEDARA